MRLTNVLFCVSFIAVAALMLMGKTVDAAVVTFTGTGVTQDVFLFQGTANGDDNWGGAGGMNVGQNGTPSRLHSLIRFDISSLGTVASVNSATLRLYLTGFNDNFNPGATITVDLHRVSAANADWVEGSSVNAVEVGASTWNDKKNPSTAWAGSLGASTSGTDFFASVLDSNAFTSGSANQYYDWVLPAASAAYGGGTLTDLINTWSAAGFGNEGFTLQPAVANKAFTAFGTSENGTPGFDPQLVIDFVPIPVIPAARAKLMATTQPSAEPDLTSIYNNSGGSWVLDDSDSTNAANGVHFSPDGQFLYITNISDDLVRRYSVSETAGVFSLSVPTTILTGTIDAPEQIVMADASTMYVTSRTDGLYRIDDPGGGGQTVTQVYSESLGDGTYFDVEIGNDGNVYFSDFANDRVLKYDVTGGGTTVFATGFSDVNGLAFDSNGDLYAAEHSNAATPIRKWNGLSWDDIVTTNLISIYDIEFNADGLLYAAEWHPSTLNRIVAYDIPGGTRTTEVDLADGGTLRFAHLDFFTSPIPPIPEPSTFLIWALGLLGLGWFGWRRRAA